MPAPSNMTYSTDFYVYKYILIPISKSICFIHPNIITILNFAFMLPIVYNIIYDKSLLQLMFLMITRQLLDLLDGSIARSCNTSSDFGAYLDITLDVIYNYTICIIVIGKLITSKKSELFYIKIALILTILACVIYGSVQLMKDRKVKFGTFANDNSLITIVFVCIFIKCFLLNKSKNI